MIKFARAGGVAAAVFALAATFSFADPSQATGPATGLEAGNYLDHAAATIDEVGAIDALAQNMLKSAEAATPRPRALGELVDAYGRTEVADSEQDCLASAVYFEARGEPIEGQLAVADVVINRTKSGKYPETICGVVEQPWQFSFVNATGRIPEPNRASQSWKKAVAISTIALNKLDAAVPEDVLWYHADYVAPSWGKRLNREKKVGLHIFYS